MTFLSGLSAFPITPMDRDGKIDAEAFSKLIARLAAAKVDSIGVLGSTGASLARSAAGLLR
ncbi:dihydrodipicolinate synthase/N-acetylneuraminate lyase [Rhizobium beringeri]